MGTPPAPPMESFYPGATQAADGDYLLFLEPPSPPAPPSPLPPSPFPPPSPLPPADLNQCECACYGEEEGAAAGQDEWDRRRARGRDGCRSSNTNLYTAYAVLARGAVVPTDAQVHVYGMSGLLQRAVHAAGALSAGGGGGTRAGGSTRRRCRPCAPSSCCGWERGRTGQRTMWPGGRCPRRALTPTSGATYCVGECFASVSDALLLHLVQVDLSASTAGRLQLLLARLHQLARATRRLGGDRAGAGARAKGAACAALHGGGAAALSRPTDLPGLGGTAFHAPAYEAGLELQGYADDLGSPAASVGGCALECARTRGGGMIRGVAYDPTSQACGCVLTELLRARRCARCCCTPARRAGCMWWSGAPGVEPAVEAQDGALVWSKERQRWCRGVVAHTGAARRRLAARVLAQVTGRAASCAASCANGHGLPARRGAGRLVRQPECGADRPPGAAAFARRAGARPRRPSRRPCRPACPRAARASASGSPSRPIHRRPRPRTGCTRCAVAWASSTWTSRAATCTSSSTCPARTIPPPWRP